MHEQTRDIAGHAARAATALALGAGAITGLYELYDIASDHHLARIDRCTDDYQTPAAVQRCVSDADDQHLAVGSLMSAASIITTFTTIAGVAYYTHKAFQPLGSQGNTKQKSKR